MKMETVTGIKGKVGQVGGKKKKVLMLLSNPFLPDPRVLKEASSLSRMYDVTVWALDREGKFPSCEDIGGIHVNRVSLAFLQPLRLIGKLLFTFFIDMTLFFLRSLSLLKKDFDVVHCHDLDTLPLGFFLGKLKKAKIIFDAHEDFPATMSLRKRTMSLFLILETLLMRHVHAVIVVGEIMREEYRKRTTKPIHVVSNWKDPQDFQQPPLDLINPRAKKARDQGKLIVSYLAGIAPTRIILPLLEAAGEDPEVFVIVAGGREHQALTTHVQEASAKLLNALYIGWLDRDQLIAYVSFSDVIYYCLHPDPPNNKYSTSNTVFSALAAGKAVLTTEIGEVGRIVKTGNCGIVMPEATKDEILLAFAKLKDPNSLQMLQQNALKTAQLYTWGKAERTLLELYGKLFGQKM
jgi:glycosyltransferase involved in cell wall biosynthesis